MNLLALAFRNLVRQKRRTGLLAAAVALGFASICLLLGLTGGMVANLKNNMSHAYGGHVFVKAEEWNANGNVVSVVTKPEQLEAALGPKDLLRAFYRRSAIETTLVFGTKTAQANLTGIEWEKETEVRASLTAVSGTLPEVLNEGQLVLNTALATRLGVQPGDPLLVKFKNQEGQQSVIDATVAAVVQTSGNGLFNSDSYVTLAQANQMLGLQRGQYQTLNVMLYDLGQQAVVAASLEKALLLEGNVQLRQKNQTAGGPGEQMLDRLLGTDESQPRWSGPRYSVSVLDDFLSMFVSVIGTLESVSFVIFLILIAVIVLGISNTFRMILRERTVEIGTLRALGLRRKGIVILFLGEAAAVLALGLVAGALLALLIGGGFSAFPVNLGDALNLFLDGGKLRFEPDFSPLVLAMLVIFGTGLLAAWRPSRQAANLLPADALRHRA
jgi:putative ABC transport system permease protein